MYIKGLKKHKINKNAENVIKNVRCNRNGSCPVLLYFLIIIFVIYIPVFTLHVKIFTLKIDKVTIFLVLMLCKITYTVLLSVNTHAENRV